MVADSASCLLSTACGAIGWCTYDPIMEACVAQDDADCQGADVCSYDGLCEAEAYACVAASAEVCAASGGCAAEGVCGLSNKTCVATVEGCAASHDCSSLGRCTLSEIYGVCSVGGDDDCAASLVCEESGACAAQVCSPEDTACEVWGACVVAQ